MNIEDFKLIFNEFFRNPPSRDIYEKVLVELITEKNNILSNLEYDKKLIDEIDKVIDSINMYLSIIPK
jgi:hypothetical protein